MFAAAGFFPGDRIQQPSGCFTPSAQLVNPVHRPDWDAWVTNHPDYSFFHGSAWANVLQSSYGFTPVYFTFSAGKPGGLFTMLPLMEVDSFLTGRRGVALPFTDECRPLFSDGASVRVMIQAALEFGKARAWKSVEFRGGREQFGEAPASLSFYGHKVNLQTDEDAMLERMEGSTRRAIRKAEKNGVVVTISRNLEAVKLFYWLHCRTRKKHGLPPQPFAFFRSIHEHVLARDAGIVAVAWCQHQPVAASVFFQLGTRAVYKYGASHEAFQHLRGANLVMWEGMKWLARNGAKQLHLGRTSLGNHGLRRFKLGWGAEEDAIDYFKYDFRQAAFVTESDPATGWHNHLCRALPVNASRAIGAALYRHWA